MSGNQAYHVLFLMIYHPTAMSDRYEELGIGYIGALLRQHGYKVSYMAVKDGKIDYEQIVRLHPDMIGLPVYFDSRNCIHRFSEQIKKILPDVMVSVGGVYPTYHGEKALEECTYIDFVIRGEGELSFLHLVEACNYHESVDAVPGIVFRGKNRIQSNPVAPLIEDLDMLPRPARDILAQNKLKIAHISSSRGCMAHCSFCTSQLFWQKWRGRDMHKVVDEIEEIVQLYNIHIFNFIDNSFEDTDSEGLQRLSVLADEVIHRRLHIAFFANIRSEFCKKATPPIMERLVQAGFLAACIGLEAANAEDLKLYGKIATVQNNIQVMNLFRKYDILVDPGFINFNPYSTLQTLNDNMRFIEAYELGTKIYNVANSFQMYEGTRLYGRVKRDGLLVTGEGPYAYRFKEERVEKLYRYIVSYRDTINVRFNYPFDVIAYFTGIRKMMVRYLYRLAQQKDDAAAQVILTRHMHELEDRIQLFGNRTCTWFRLLLKLAGGRWSSKEADEISEKYYSSRYIVSLTENLFRFHRNLYIDLIRTNKNFGSILNQVF